MSDNIDWQLWACGEFCSITPTGEIRAADQSERGHWQVNAGEKLRLPAVRNGWLSFRAVVRGRGDYSLSAFVRGGAIAVELLREFYHKLDGRDEWIADALVPVRSRARQMLPDPDNAVPDQTAQSFWVDLYVPADAAVGEHKGKLTVNVGRARGRAGSPEDDSPETERLLTIDLQIDVLELAYPDADCVQIDHNSYGSTFLEKLYPKTVPARPGPKKTAALIGLIHKYHALVYEHHGVYHQLGYGHSGATTPLFAPALAGNGHSRHVSDWRIYDAHYGPLLDGSAFANCRRKAAPVYSIYTPFNPAWPADWLSFGQPGYDVEYTNVLRDFDEHFRTNGWTNTVVEFFFNHKKRYRFFEWDGDEPRFPQDDGYFRYYRKLLDAATAGSPVKWRFRIDASWMQKEHWTSLAGVTDFWVNGGFVNMFEKQVHAGPMSRDDIVWTYSGGAGLSDPSSHISQLVYRTWIRDFTGNVNWLTTSPSPDPWFASRGERECLMYPGERFGIAGPIPCIRLKIQRNAVQDVNMLNQLAQRIGKDRIKADLIPTIPIELWYEPTDGVRTLPPHEWTSKVLRRPVEPNEIRLKDIDPLWWQAVRQYAVAGH